MDKKKLYLDELIGAVLLGVMSLLTFLNVMNRYFLKHSFAFTEEITISLFVWISLLGISMAYRRGSNLRMTNLFDVLSPRLQRVSIIVSGVLSIAIFIFLIFNSAAEIYKNMTFYHTTSESLGIPTWIYSMGTPVFSIIVIRSIVTSMVRGIKRADNPKKEAN